ncbi:uncharacterized protein LOC128663760 [Bombina bombina]|uniref:uncharacterized protein LOC128663760 n=1 Tax=Bombina bombina TaxID=8345 RepID=UPI00235A73F3|nr:uncharacterized protein LOC128663760 [Bombina bombina]
MWNLLFVTLLIPQPVFSQFGASYDKCEHCKKLRDPPATEQFQKYLQNVKSYDNCPSNRVRFNVENAFFCAENTQDWVKSLKACLDNKINSCLKTVDAGPNKDFSKGSAKDLSMLPSTTADYATKILGNILKKEYTVTSTQPTMTTTENPGQTNLEVHTQQDSEKLQDEIHPTSAEELERKMQNSTVAIISLIIICLFLTSIVTFFICNRKKNSSRHLSKILCAFNETKYDKAGTDVT